MQKQLTNQLTMVGSVLKIADSDEFAPVWADNAPLAFGSDLATLRTDYATVNKLASQAISAKGGSGNAKAAAELALENAAFVATRALANHFKKTGDLDKLGKVDYTKSAIVLLRHQDLINKANMIRDIGLSVKDQQGAIERGIPTVTATLTEKIAAFSAVMNLPRGEIVSRATLLKEVSTDIANLLEQLHSLDDLVEQYAATDQGARFVTAWKHARAIVDTSHAIRPDDNPPVDPAKA